jgi:hypothetical protein
MKRRRWIVLIRLVFVAVLAATPVLATVAAADTFGMGSANYLIPAGALSAGGGKMASAGYRLQGTLGQGSLGASASASYTTNAGYWQPVYAPALTLANGSALGVVLAWPSVPVDSGGYQVWWSTAPYFQPSDPGSDSALLPAAAVQWTQPDSGDANYFYIIRGINSLGQASPPSNRAGRFRFTIMRGG